jgi:lipopolysaccharide transport protein LptA
VISSISVVRRIGSGLVMGVRFVRCCTIYRFCKESSHALGAPDTNVIIHFSKPDGHARSLNLHPLALACIGALPLAVLGVPWCVAVAQPPATSQQAAQQQPIIINSVSSNVDYRTNTAVFTDIAVSQGDTRLTAERASATGVGFTDSQWTFAGRVVIVLQPRGTLSADQAIVQFRNSEVIQVTAIGSPAYFEQQPADDSRQPTKGHADRITYDPKQDTVRLNGHAQLSDGRNVEVSAPVLVYKVQDEKLQAESPGEKRGVHTTIIPPPTITPPK